MSETPFAPTLSTPHLRLRPMQLEDAALIAAYCNSDAVARMTGTFVTPYLPLSAEFFILRQPSLERRGLCQNWVMEYEGALCGVIGMFRPDRMREWELGYWLGEPYWGRGRVSEAVQAVLAEFQRVEGNTPLWARVFHDNPASIRVLEKNGFVVTEPESGYCMQRQATVNGVRLRSPYLDGDT